MRQNARHRVVYDRESAYGIMKNKIDMVPTLMKHLNFFLNSVH